jgi:hypothetical protein
VDKVNEMSQKFEWTSEAEEYIREQFTNIGMGKAYHKRIVIKKQFIGYDNDLNPVTKYTNRFGIFYLIQTACNTIVTSELPEMSSTF